MGFNFPNSPATNETFAPAGGPVYVWNGASWMITQPVIANVYTKTESDSRYIEAAGDTMTGPLTATTLTVSGNVSGNLSLAGNFLPDANGTRNLGSATLRWGTIYTSDLSLSNGIGDWTIVEGEEDLFILNNKNGKTYKFALIELNQV